MDEKFMRRAIELAKQAETFDEVPIGAVIVLNGEIVAEGNNRKERDNSAISHAEIVALKNANEKLGWYLSDCEMYVTSGEKDNRRRVPKSRLLRHSLRPSDGQAVQPQTPCRRGHLERRMRRAPFGIFQEKTQKRQRHTR